MSSFQFKQFAIQQNNAAMKVTSEAVLFGALAEPNADAKTALDIGCGTGLLSLMLAQRFPQLQITALDIDSDAVSETLTNFDQSPWRERLTLMQADIVDFAHNSQQRYDFIICNPPFYHKGKTSLDNAKNSAWHLSDTLSPTVFAQLISQLLSDTGSACFLWPTHEGELFGLACQQLGLYVQLENQLQHNEQKPSKRCIVSVSKAAAKTKHLTTTIFQSDGIYNAKIQRALKPYYLKL